jgi:hypothetical protein
LKSLDNYWQKQHDKRDQERLYEKQVVFEVRVDMLMRLYNDFNLLRLAYEKAEENGIEEGSDTHEEIKSMPLTLINADINISA